MGLLAHHLWRTHPCVLRRDSSRRRADIDTSVDAARKSARATRRLQRSRPFTEELRSVLSRRRTSARWDPARSPGRCTGRACSLASGTLKRNGTALVFAFKPSDTCSGSVSKAFTFAAVEADIRHHRLRGIGGWFVGFQIDVKILVVAEHSRHAGDQLHSVLDERVRRQNLLVLFGGWPRRRPASRAGCSAPPN